MLRVGYSGILPPGAPHYMAFEKRMAELGWEQGRNFTFEYLQSPSITGYEGTYRELVARKVDILLAAGNEPALRAALAAGEGLPVAFIALDFDPIATSYVTSLSRPGGNMTGVFVSQLELAGKRVELLREAVPNAQLIGLLWDAASHEQAVAAAAAAQRLGLHPRLLSAVGQPPDYAEALARLTDGPERAGGDPGKPARLARPCGDRGAAARAPQPLHCGIS